MYLVVSKLLQYIHVNISLRCQGIEHADDLVADLRQALEDLKPLSHPAGPVPAAALPVGEGSNAAEEASNLKRLLQEAYEKIEQLQQQQQQQLKVQIRSILILNSFGFQFILFSLLLKRCEERPKWTQQDLLQQQYIFSFQVSSIAHE